MKRDALLDLNDRIFEAAGIAAMTFIASEVVGRALDATSAGYGTMDADMDGFVIEQNWSASGIPSIAGRYRMQDFGRYSPDLRLGRNVVIPDVRLDPRTVDTVAALEEAGGRAFVNIPVMERGRMVAVFFVLSTTPRLWTAEELAFIREVGDRTRSAVERRRAEDDLRALAASLERQVAERTAERNQIWQVSRDLLMVSDAHGRWLSVNPAWTRVLGWSQTELVGRTSEWLEHPDDQAKTRAEIGKLAEGQATLSFENRFRTKDGSYRTLSWTAAPFEGRFYCSARDVTEEKDREQALAHAEEALRQSQKMEAVGQLTGGLAHDFNNLLAGISGSLEMMQNRMSQGRFNDVERYMAAAQGASKRAAALTHRLLAFSRRQTLDPKPTNVNRLITGMEDLIRRTIGPAIHLETVGAACLWPALVDPSQLENALLNLCINARDAMPDGGRITIETANRWLDRPAAQAHAVPEGQYLSMCVTDTGTGMPPEVIARVFEPFFTTKPIGEGTGLGLSMIYGFAQLSGGQVRVYSEVGEGTTVCIYLPRHLGEGEVDEATEKALALPRAEQGETVLVVDDEPTVRMLVTDILEDLGYTAIEAGDSVAGLKVLQSDVRIDLLVTDVGLPGGMNGRQMADAGRETRPDLKVLFITGYAENSVLGNGHLAHGMAVLTKPFPVEAMAARIREMIAS